MTELQRKTAELFKAVKDSAQVKKLANGITEYVYTEAEWTYSFFTINGQLKKAEGCNHRQLIEVQF